jgi:hypothetical protein
MKNTLMILVVGALLGTMLVGCGTPAEGNAPDGATPSTKSGDPSAAGTVDKAGENAPMDANKPATP